MKLLKSIIFLTILTGLSFTQTTYVWTGAVNSSFSTAGNWTPLRQVGLNTDILVFESGSNLNLTNVYQVTIGQLIVRSNTNLTLSPASGNAKCISIKGSAGEDLLIESGSSLKISGNDPALNIYLLTGATADVSGSMTFQGEIAHNLNSADPLSIKFNAGSVLTQNCPGNIFNTTGSLNSAIFRNGSVLKLNHANALSPFGVSAPNTKIILESQSSIVIQGTSSIKLEGRVIPNLTVEQNSVLNAKESYTLGVTFGSLTVKNTGTIKIENTNTTGAADLNIHGNIDVTGSLIFSTNSGSKFRVNLNGTEAQSISGSGEIAIPSNLEKFTIDNDVVFNRNLNIECAFAYDSGILSLNGFSLNLPNGKKLSNSVTSPITGKPEPNSNSTSINNVPDQFSVSQNYPNPFNPSTKIDFNLPNDSRVTIKVYDITGKVVATILNSEVEAGYHTASFDASGLSSGIYFYTISAGNFSKTMKMILTK